MSTEEKKEKRRIYKRNWMREDRRKKEELIKQLDGTPKKKKLSEWLSEDNKNIKKDLTKWIDEDPENLNKDIVEEVKPKHFTCCGKKRSESMRNRHINSVEHLENNDEIIPGIKIE